MVSLGDFWRRHRRKLLIGVGILGGGYCAYNLYDAHRKKLAELESEFANEREKDELAKAQMQAHFEKIQRIADTTRLPHAMHYLSGRIAEELDLSRLTERLMRGKGQPNTLTPEEKLNLWDQLKVLSFTRLLSSLWGMVILSLYIRVQVNILGRHLYIDTAHGLGSSQVLEDADPVGMDDQQKFLASADFLSSHGLPAVLSHMQEATREVLKGKHLRDYFDNATLHQTILQVLDKFMSAASPHHWVGYLMPENGRSDVTTTTDDSILPAAATFNQLMVETESVLLSSEFGGIVEMSLKMVANAIVEDFAIPAEGSTVPFGVPLAKLLPRLAQMCPLLLEEPSRNRYLQVIGNSPEVELFFTLLYASTELSQQQRGPSFVA